ncbi:hypothetical protein, partial [Mycoplasma todarodis]
MPTLKGSTISKISAKANPNGNGEITISVEVTTPGANPKTHTITKVVNAKTDNMINADLIQKDNLQKIKNSLRNLHFPSQGSTTASTIAKGINAVTGIAGKIAAIDAATNGAVTIPNGSQIAGTTIEDIILVAQPDGTILVKVVTKTTGASIEDATVSKTAHGQSDADVAQNVNNKKFEDLFKNAKLINQGNRTTSEVAKSMNKGSLADKIKAIETETGIKVPTTVNGTKITGIRITEKADGVISVEITTETLGAKTP